MKPAGPIAYLTGEYPRATDTFIQREVQGLRTCGITVHTCSIRKTGPEHIVGEEQRIEAKQTFYVLDAAKNPLRLIRCNFKLLFKSPVNYFRAFNLALKTNPAGIKALLFQLFYFLEATILADHLQKNDIKQLHNHIAKSSCTVAMLASELSGIPFSFTLHGPDIFFEAHKWRLDEKIKRARFVACISHYCRSQAMAFSDTADWEKLHIIHCGVEPDRYQRPKTTTEQNLLFVGRLAAVKGLPILFNAMEHLTKRNPDLSLTLIGDGPDRSALERQAEPFGNRIKFVGYKSQTEVVEYLRATDILVLPSFAEGVPVVLMEAMAASIPVVTTRIAGVPELVENSVSGVLVPPGDVDALASGLSSIITDSSLRNKMGVAGRKKVMSEFNINKETRWLADVFTAYENNASVGLRPSLEGKDGTT